MAKYDLQIELLERLIHNWYDIKTPDDFYNVFPEYKKTFLTLTHKTGICHIANIHCLEQGVRWKMFKDWDYCKDVVYPVGGKHEYDNIDLITDNPKRLHLATHCLQWLRQRNIEEV